MTLSNAGAERDAGVRSVGRAVDLLEAFDLAHPARTLRELVEVTGLPKSTVLRLVSTWEQRGYLVLLGDGRYALGPGLLRWVRAAQALWQVSPAAMAEMRALVEKYGETVNIYVRQGEHRVSIAQEEGTATVRSVVVVGLPMPMDVGASGRVLRTGVDVAVSHGEREVGASSVAAAVRASNGRVLAAVAMSGPTSRFVDETVQEYEKAVRAAASQIAAQGLGSVEALL